VPYELEEGLLLPGALSRARPGRLAPDLAPAAAESPGTVVFKLTDACWRGLRTR
jgi:hypothetical protein